MPQTLHRAIRGALAVLLVAGLAGCAMKTEPTSQPAGDAVESPPVFNNQPMQAVSDGKARPANQYTLLVRLRMIPIEVPVGTISNSERLWSYHDEEITGLAAQVALNRNGIRVGRSSMDDWPAVRKMLREMTGKATSESTYMAKPGQPMNIVLKEHQGIQHMFVFNSRGELVGNDYPPGDNVLLLACHLGEDDPTAITLQGVPAVRSAYELPQYLKTEAGYMLKTAPVMYPLDSMQFTVPVPQGTYLVIGPGTTVEQVSSPGNNFLVNVRQGLQFETLLVLVPEVFAAPISQDTKP